MTLTGKNLDIETTEHNFNSAYALEELHDQVKVAVTFTTMMREMTPEETFKFRAQHPGAHFVIGDFEIKCLHPEKYRL